MNVLSARATNFGSYKKVEFRFNARGLTLISGDTGSGKSTLCDLIPWTLFGKTAKNGAADDVVKWPKDDPAEGSVLLEASGNIIEVTRIRGKARDNDLYFLKNGEIIRGKDLLDTQKLLSAELGLDSDLYLMGSYLHEFSEVSMFFNSPAKTRRQLIEQLVDLGLNIRLSEAISSKNEELEELEENIKAEISKAEAKEIQLIEQLKSDRRRGEEWTIKQKAKIKEAQEAAAGFDDELEQERTDTAEKHLNTMARYNDELADLFQPKKISDLEKEEAALKEALETFVDSTCPTCGAPKDADKRLVLKKSLNEVQSAIYYARRAEQRREQVLASMQREEGTFSAAIEKISQKKNPYFEIKKSLEGEANPFSSGIPDLERRLSDERKNNFQFNQMLMSVQGQLQDLEILAGVNKEFRNAVINSTISEVEENTNKTLEKHFDSEMQVTFEIEGADKLNAVIYKDGNTCSYTQLSKGQRQILKLCFGVSVMKAMSNRHGMESRMLFFDEVADGLDSKFKEKVFGLLQELELEYDSIFVTEHSSEMKEKFLNRFEVRMESGDSVLCQS